MEESTSKEKVLKSIRNALINKNENPFKDLSMDKMVHEPLTDEPEVHFAEALSNVGGNFIYCSDEQEFLSQLKDLIGSKKWPAVHCHNPQLADILKIGEIETIEDEEKFTEALVGITFCEFLVARQGSVMISSAISGGRRINVYPEIHLVFAYASQMVNELKEALSGMQARYKNDLPSLITTITGPSRTADIEKTLVMGAHGPKELYVFLIDDADMPVQ